MLQMQSNSQGLINASASRRHPRRERRACGNSVGGASAFDWASVAADLNGELSPAAHPGLASRGTAF